MSHGQPPPLSVAPQPLDERNGSAVDGGFDVGAGFVVAVGVVAVGVAGGRVDGGRATGLDVGWDASRGAGAEVTAAPASQPTPLWSASRPYTSLPTTSTGPVT